MDNLYVWRLVMGTGLAIFVMAAVLAFVYMKFPDSLVVGAPLLALAAAGLYYVNKREKSARFNVYYQCVRDLDARPIFFGNLDAAFEKDGTRFDAGFPRGKYSTNFTVNFHLPNIRQKFSIQNKNLLTTQHADCELIQDSPLPPEYHLQSRNPDFLLNLLKIRDVYNEMLSYEASFWGKISISFDDGSFEMLWTPPVSEQIEGFSRVCRTAVVFHDELKKLR